MEHLSAVIARVRRHGEESAPLDANFDDDYSSSSEEAPPEPPPAPERVQDVRHTFEVGLAAARERGFSSKALAFFEFAAERAAARPTWRALDAGALGGRCEALGKGDATHEVRLSDSRGRVALRTGEEAFQAAVAAAYYATFRLPEADVYACGKSLADVARNYERAKRCFLAGVGARGTFAAPI